MKKIFLYVLCLCSFLLLHSQDNETKMATPYSIDFVMGPYLILDGTIYESVLLRGVRIGYDMHPRYTIGLEYLVGNQEDLAGQLGTTHSAFANFKYYFKDKETRFRPFLLAGGGFFEFKDFSRDVLGVSFYLSAGYDMRLTKNVKAFLEPRYVNLGLLGADGTHQFGMMWGIRGEF